VYRLVPDPAVLDQIAALPDEAVEPYADLLDALVLAPWDGRPQHEANPAGPLRRWAFGPGRAGQVIYLILEAEHEVHLLLVQWLS
jgi:hypothetical protein